MVNPLHPTPADRAAARALARSPALPGCGYHVEWYSGRRYVRPLAAICSHDPAGTTVTYGLYPDGWRPWWPVPQEVARGQE